MCQRRRKNGATPLDLANNDICCKILEYHASIYASITENSRTLVAAALAHCATLSASEETLPATELTLREYHSGPAFLWAPPAARSAVVAWAQGVFIVQLAAKSELFNRLPVDCAGDVLEFFGATPIDSGRIAKHCSSPEACDWVRAVVAAAVVVGTRTCLH